MTTCRELLERIVACIDASASGDLFGLGGDVVSACRVLAKTGQVTEARAFLSCQKCGGTRVAPVLGGDVTMSSCPECGEKE